MAPLAPPEEKIVGGSDTRPHEYPWQAAVYIDDKYFCGGSLISSEWVMTAAHCLYGAQHVTVVLGAHNISNPSEKSQLSLESTDFFIHEDYEPRILENDIAMIHLPENVTFNIYIQPVCLPHPPDIGVGFIVRPTGWGYTQDGAEVGSDVLMEVNVYTEEDKKCINYYSELSFTEKNICIDTSYGKGACSGDSGGPANYAALTGFQVRGIISYGSTAVCSSGAPDVFTRVTHFLDWIRDNTGVIR